MFISTTRLSVHNLPVSLDEKKLKAAVLKQLNDKTARITEVSKNTAYYDTTRSLKSEVE